MAATGFFTFYAFAKLGRRIDYKSNKNYNNKVDLLSYRVEVLVDERH